MRSCRSHGGFTLNLVPLTVEQAEKFLTSHERHYKSNALPVFALGISDGAICGAVIVGVSGEDAELSHIYSDGESLGYTLLYGAAWRAAKALGYVRMIL